MKKIIIKPFEKINRMKVNRYDENGDLRKTGAELESFNKAKQCFNRKPYQAKYNLKCEDA